jgi:hypothetical protein
VQTLIEEATNTNLIVFALVQPGFESRNNCGHANHYITDAISFVIDGQ